MLLPRTDGDESSPPGRGEEFGNKVLQMLRCLSPNASPVDWFVENPTRQPTTINLSPAFIRGEELKKRATTGY